MNQIMLLLSLRKVKPKENLSKTRPVRGIIVIAKGEVSNKLTMAVRGMQTSSDLIKLKEIPIEIGDLK